MKITGVRTKLYEYEMLRPLGDANSPKGRSHVASLAVFIDTDEGITEYLRALRARVGQFIPWSIPCS